MTETLRLPDGTDHEPIPWDDLVPYEQQQGGYWLYGPWCDVYGKGKIWVRCQRVTPPAAPGLARHKTAGPATFPAMTTQEVPAMAAVPAALNKAVMVRSGDTLVIGIVDDSQHPDDLERMRDEIKDYLPGLEVLVILGAESMAVYRPDTETGPGQLVTQPSCPV